MHTAGLNILRIHGADEDTFHVVGNALHQSDGFIYGKKPLTRRISAITNFKNS
jgi:hypothetical protein